MMNFKTMPDMKWLAGKSSLILILRDHDVDVVWLEQSLLGPVIHLMERFARDEQTPEVVAQRMLATGKTPSRVLVCLPRLMVMQRTLVYPIAVQNDLVQMLQFEAARHVPLPEADRRIAFMAAPLPGGKQVGVNLIAVRHSELSALLDPWIRAGIPVDEVSTLSSLLTPPSGDVPVLHVLTDESQFELVLFANGLLQASLVVDRTARGFSKETVVDAARRMSVQHRELLGAEGIGRIVCSGKDELPDEIRESLEVAFGMHLHPLEIPELLRPGVGSLADDPVLTEALCAAAAEPPPSLNLTEQSGRKVPVSRRTLMIAGLCALLAVELLGGWLVRTFSPVMALKSVARETAEFKSRSASIQLVKNQNRELRNDLEQLAEIGRTRASIMSMLKVLSDTLPEDTYLRGFTYTRGEDIKIKGRSKKPDELPHLVLSLPFVSTIETSDIGEKTDEYYSFNLSVALKENAQ